MLRSEVRYEWSISRLWRLLGQSCLEVPLLELSHLIPKSKPFDRCTSWGTGTLEIPSLEYSRTAMVPLSYLLLHRITRVSTER